MKYFLQLSIFCCFIGFALIGCSPRIGHLLHYEHVQAFHNKTLHIYIPTQDDSAVALYSKYNQYQKAAKLQKRIDEDRATITDAFDQYFDFAKVQYHENPILNYSDDDYFLQIFIEQKINEQGEVENVVNFQIVDFEQRVIASTTAFGFSYKSKIRSVAKRLNQQLHRTYKKAINLQNS